MPKKKKKRRSKMRVHRFNLSSGANLEHLRAPAALFIARKRC
jgi:hypothetical protein